jgi:hypothetical protein
MSISCKYLDRQLSIDRIQSPFVSMFRSCSLFRNGVRGQCRGNLTRALQRDFKAVWQIRQICESSDKPYCVNLP